MGNKQFSQNNLNHLHKFIYIKNVNFLHPNHVKCKKILKSELKIEGLATWEKIRVSQVMSGKKKNVWISLLLMGILIEFNTSQAAKSQCYSYEAALLLQLKSGSAAASRQVERKVGLSGSKRRGGKKKKSNKKPPNRCVNFFIWSILFGCFFKQSAAVAVRSYEDIGGITVMCY